MGSASAQLDGGPMVLSWHKQNGTDPQARIAEVVSILDRRRGRDCPDHLWDPNKRFIPEMKKSWLHFLELRETIRGQVISLAGGLTKKYEGIQFIDLHGKVVDRKDAAAGYLRYLPPSLVPAEATAFLPTNEVKHCLGEFKALVQRVRDYIPDYQRPLDDTAAEAERETDARYALAKFRNLVGRFGNFTIEHRMSMTGLGRNAFAGYDLAADIRSCVSELSTLQHKVGPFERSLTLLWYEMAVPASVHLRLDGNVKHFLLEHLKWVGEDEAHQALNLITRLTDQHGVKISDPTQAAAIATSLAENTSGIANLSTMSRAILKAFVIELPFELVLNYEVKVLLHLTDEDGFDRALYEAVLAQPTNI